MKAARFFVVVVTLAFASQSFAQKMQRNYDRNFDFSRLKTYAWKERHLVTHQNPEDTARIEQAILTEVNRQLAAKGLQETKDKPDFYLSYDGGGYGNFDAALAPNLIHPDASWTSPGYKGGGVDVWVSVDGRILFTVTDPQSNTPVWQALLSKKFRDPNKVMGQVDQEAKQIAKKAFGDFPPKGKT